MAIRNRKGAESAIIQNPCNIHPTKKYAHGIDKKYK
jgi:hypothetical protein